jgi:hypothetical protein
LCIFVSVLIVVIFIFIVIIIGAAPSARVAMPRAQLAVLYAPLGDSATPGTRYPHPARFRKNILVLYCIAIGLGQFYCKIDGNFFK